MNNTNAVNVGLTIASKSIPRSGHHLLKEILSAGFGAAFTHCEWYQEPGCCRQVPCKLFGAYCDNGQTVRLIKSHDLQLDEQPPCVGPNLVTAIGYRHPLWTLTSQFVYLLREMESKRLGVYLKMQYLHEPAVVNLLTENCHHHLASWSQGALDIWLAEQSSYQVRFFRKWLRGDSSEVHFDETTGFLNCPYEQLSRIENARVLLEWFASKSCLSFWASSDADLSFIRPVRSPWHCTNRRVSDFLNANRLTFARAAAFIAHEAGLQYEASMSHLQADLPSTGVGSLMFSVVSRAPECRKEKDVGELATSFLVQENLALKQETAALQLSLKEAEARCNARQKGVAQQLGSRMRAFFRGQL